MSSDNNLQEMEGGTTQSKTAVNANAKAADPMPTLADPGTQLASVVDLGGPTPENYKTDDDSAKFKDPSATLKQVKDIVNKGAKAADAMPAGVKEDEEVEGEVIEEQEELEDQVVSEEEVEETVTEAEETVEEEVESEETFDVEEDVNALLQTSEEEAELSEEFKEKAKLIFESALKTKVTQIRETLETQYEEKLVESVSQIRAELQERTDAYLEYVSSEWMTENQLAVEGGLKEDINDSFMTGLKGLFEEHYVTIPEDKYDVLDSMVEKLDEMETKLNEQLEKNISLNSRLAESVADGVFDEVSEGLASTQKEKLASLAESVEFESEAQYREKLETLKESYFPSKAVSQTAKTETLSEGVDVATEYHSDSMNAYLKALSAVAKN
jgi:hypothetical protein